MAEKPYIRRFKSLKNLGVFHDYAAKADIPEFRQFNLIYGFNGTGKTTLSRILASLEAGVLRPELPSDGEFDVELTDDELIKATAKLSALKGRLLVFNVDFVEANFRWKDGAANPIFYLGAAQTKLSQQLESIESSISSKSAKATEAANLYNGAHRMFAGYKRDIARQIEQEIGLARKYDASNLTADYENQTYGDACKLDQKLIKQQIAIINQDAPLPKLNLIGHARPDIPNWVAMCKTLLESKIGSLILSDLQLACTRFG